MYVGIENPGRTELGYGAVCVCVGELGVISSIFTSKCLKTVFLKTISCAPLIIKQEKRLTCSPPCPAGRGRMSRPSAAGTCEPADAHRPAAAAQGKNRGSNPLLEGKPDTGSEAQL